MHQLMRVASRPLQSSSTWSQKRSLHRSPDFRYLEIWKRSAVLFQEHYKDIYLYPRLVNQILRTAAASKIKGFIPFIHAVPASLNVVQKVWMHHGIRSPGSVYAERSYEEALQEIPSKLVRVPRPGLLSMSYALTSGVSCLETAASWGFRNHFKTEQCSSMTDKLYQSLQSIGVKADSYFARKGRYLIYQYAQLNVGDFLVINIPPDMVERYVFDSCPYNVPTGRKAIDVALHPKDYVKDLLEAPNTHIANLVLCKETLGKDSKISIVRANASAEVDCFCKDVSLLPMHEIEIFDGLTSASFTRQEEDYLARRMELDRDLESYAKRLQEDRGREIFEEVPNIWYEGYMI